MTFEHVAVATDFSRVGERAIDVGLELASRASARLSLVHTYDPLPVGAAAHPAVWCEGGEVAEGRERDARRSLAVAADRTAYPKVERQLLRHPHVAAGICEFVEAQRPELLVLGTHGRSGLSRFLIGSVAEKVVRHAACPVLVVRAAARLPRRVSVCTDLSPNALAVLEMAALFASLYEPEITLVHVEDARHGALDAETHAEVLAELHAQLRQLYLAHLPGPPRVSILSGSNVTEALAAHAADAATELLVLGTHGESGLERLLIGSVAERVTRHAPCSVLVARPTAGKAGFRPVPARNVGAASLSGGLFE